MKRNLTKLSLLNGVVPRSAFDGDLSTDERAQARIRTLVADHDPISRRVVEGVLRSCDELEVTAVDSHRPLLEWPLRRLDVVVLGLASGESPTGTVRELSARELRVLLVGIDWTRRGLDDAAAAGAVGFLVKDPELTGIVGGVQAVAAGNVVLSPELLELYVPRSADGSARHQRAAEAVHRLSDREREVLTLLGEGLSTAEAARVCGVSSTTIKSHVSHALTKLGARNRLEAVLMVKDESAQR
jgi:two-component system, NarL family, nitrate/nitrite response regulator NarL